MLFKFCVCNDEGRWPLNRTYFESQSMGHWLLWKCDRCKLYCWAAFLLELLFCRDFQLLRVSRQLQQHVSGAINTLLTLNGCHSSMLQWLTPKATLLVLVIQFSVYILMFDVDMCNRYITSADKNKIENSSGLLMLFAEPASNSILLHKSILCIF